MLVKTIIAACAALLSGAVALPAPGGGGGGGTPPSGVTTFALKTSSAAASQVYLVPGGGAKKLHVFAVGTTFADTDYTDLAGALAQNGVVSVIVDFGPGSTFKTATNFPAAFDTTISALNQIQWQSQYNITVSTDASNVFIGGHSVGGKAAIDYAASLNGAYTFAGIADWDPVDGQTASTSDSFSVPHVIFNPIDSGCSGQISSSNNGVYYYNLAKAGGGGTTLVQYTNTNIHHNTVTSSGGIGNLVCAGTVNGFQADLGAKIAAFVKNPPAFVSGLKPNPSGTFAYTVQTK